MAANYDATDLIDISKATYPNGFKVTISGADDCRGNSSPYTDSNVCMFNSNKDMIWSTYLDNLTEKGITCTLTSDRTGITIVSNSDFNHDTYSYIAFTVKDTSHDCVCTVEPL